MPEIFWSKTREMSSSKSDFGKGLVMFKQRLLELDYRYVESSIMTLSGRLILSLILTLKYHTEWQDSILDIGYSANGKPYFLSSADGFNISHSGAYVTVAFLKDNKIGIDVQVIAKMKHHLIEIYLHPEEVERMRMCGDIHSKKKFLAWVWSRKEALLKYTGEGICLSRLIKINVLYDEISGSGFGNATIHSEALNKDCIVSIAYPSSVQEKTIIRTKLSCKKLISFVRNNCDNVNIPFPDKT